MKRIPSKPFPELGQILAIVIDLGGVIATSIEEALFGLVEAHTSRPLASKEHLLGIWHPLYMDASLGRLHPDELWRRVRRRVDLGSLPAGQEDAVFLGRIHLCDPSIPDALSEVKEKYALAVLSNYVGRWARALLERDEVMPLLDAVLISSEAGMRKPTPVIYERVCQLLGVAPRLAAYVGDEEEDLIGCQEAGMLPVFIPGQDSASSVGLRIETISDLLRLA